MAVRARVAWRILRSGKVLPTEVAALASIGFEIAGSLRPEWSWTPASGFSVLFGVPQWTWWLLLGVLFVLGFLGGAVEHVVRAEADRDAALDQGKGAPPIADIAAKSAIAYLTDHSAWGVSQKAKVGEALLVSLAKDEFEEAASKGKLKVWGRSQFLPDYAEIPNTYWATGQLDYMDLLESNRSDGRTEAKVLVAQFQRYEGLRVSQAQVEALWPRGG